MEIGTVLQLDATRERISRERNQTGEIGGLHTGQRLHTHDQFFGESVGLAGSEVTLLRFTLAVCI